MQTFGDRVAIAPDCPGDSQQCLSPLRCAQGQALSASRGSGSPDGEILRFAQDDSQDTSQVRSSLISKCLG